MQLYIRHLIAIAREQSTVVTSIPVEEQVSTKVIESLGHALPMPNGQVDSIRIYYGRVNHSVAGDIVDALNEELLLDVGLTLREIEKVYLARYYSVYGTGIQRAGGMPSPRCGSKLLQLAMGAVNNEASK